MERLNKLLAARGVASRRTADQLIAEGRVSVNGSVVTELGTKVSADDSILVDGKLVPRVTHITLAAHKPRGVVTSLKAQGDAKIISSLVPRIPGLHPVGRLDKDSEGLILLTNDGSLTQKLTHPSFKHQKEYEVHCTSEKVIDTKAIQEALLKGVKLGDGKAKADAVTTKSMQNGILTLVITVHEGRHHLIRRMCSSVGLHVTKLIRTRISSLTLEGLKPGEWRELTSSELHELA